MAATDTFESILGDLGDRDREVLKNLILMTREDILAARSEEARLRTVDDFARIIHDALHPARRA
jgi:hypothetical protein